MKLFLEICILGRKACLRQGIRYIMVLLFVEVKIAVVVIVLWSEVYGYYCNRAVKDWSIRADVVPSVLTRGGPCALPWGSTASQSL